MFYKELLDILFHQMLITYLDEYSIIVDVKSVNDLLFRKIM